MAAFTLAAAITIAKTQIPQLVGASKTKSWDATAVIVSFASLAVLEAVRLIRRPFLLSKLGPVVLMTTLIAVELVQPTGLDLVGHIPRGLPSFGGTLRTGGVVATLSAGDLAQLSFAAIPCALVGFAEAFAIARASSAKYALPDGSPALPLDADRELLALASANAWTSVVGGFPVTGSFSRTSVNADAGASSAMSAFVAAVFVALVLEVLTDVLGSLPKVAVAAVVVSAIVRLVDVALLRKVLSPASHVSRNARITYVCVAVVGVLFGVEWGLLLGVVLGRALPSSLEAEEGVSSSASAVVVEAAGPPVSGAPLTVAAAV